MTFTPDCLRSNWDRLTHTYSHRHSFQSFRFLGLLLSGRVLRHEQDTEIAFLRAQGLLRIEEKHLGAVCEESHALAQELGIEENGDLTFNLADGVVLAGRL